MAKKQSEKPHNQDVLEAYPEREQVASFPERRYVKMIRFLTIVTIVNLSILMALSGLYFYMTRHVDISVEKNGRVLFYFIDPEKKQLLSSEREKTQVSALSIVMEETILKYLKTRYSYIYERDKMAQRWEKLPEDSNSTEFNIPIFSSDDVFMKFSNNRKQISYNLFQEKIIQEVRIYNLYQARGDLWAAYLEVYDFKLNDNLESPCSCQEDSEKCWQCKEEKKIAKRRYKIWLRARFLNEKDRDQSVIYRNPLNIQIYAFYELPIRIPDIDEIDQESYWGLPAGLGKSI